VYVLGVGKESSCIMRQIAANTSEEDGKPSNRHHHWRISETDEKESILILQASSLIIKKIL